MAPAPLSRLQPSRDEAIEDWPWLDQDVLRSSRSRQVCMTCHFFRLPGVNYVGGSRQLRRRVGPPPPCHGRGVGRADGHGRLAGN